MISTIPIFPEGPHEAEPEDYLNTAHGWKSWFFTFDHKRIALLYLFSMTAMFSLGGSLAVAIRLHLITPNGLFSPDTYIRLVSVHGAVMVSLLLIPSIPASLGNFLLPIMIGAKNLAFPRVNLVSWYLYVIGALFGTYTAAINDGNSGWTFYTPYSTTYSSGYVISASFGVFLAGLSSTLTGLNFVVTVHSMRAPGMSWGRLPLFVWSHYSNGLIQILAAPLLAIALVLISLQRAMHVGVFDPAVGGAPVLFQNIFWLGSLSAAYIVILPGMGVISEVIACFSRKRIFGYKFVAACFFGVALLGFLVWGRHAFIPGQRTHSGIFLSFLSILAALPFAGMLFNWILTMYKGSVTFKSPMLYAFAFIGLLIIGGLYGLYLSTLATNVAWQGTYFAVAHLHFFMVGATAMAFMAGLHFWWPKISGRMYSEVWAKFSAIWLFIGFNLAFIPQYILGYMGMPRLYAAYPPEFQALNIMSSAGAAVMGIGFLIPIIYLTWSWFHGPKVGNNPWDAAGLEWQIDSPPI